MRVKLHLVPYQSPNEFDGAIAGMRRDGDEALLVMPGPIAYNHATRLAELAATHRLPAIMPYQEFAEAGGLMTYGAKFVDMYRRACALVDKLLKGVKPSDVPVERASRFELVINPRRPSA